MSALLKSQQLKKYIGWYKANVNNNRNFVIFVSPEGNMSKDNGIIIDRDTRTPKLKSPMKAFETSSTKVTIINDNIEAWKTEAAKEAICAIYEEAYHQSFEEMYGGVFGDEFAEAANDSAYSINLDIINQNQGTDGWRYEKLGRLQDFQEYIESGKENYDMEFIQDVFASTDWDYMGTDDKSTGIYDLIQMELIEVSNSGYILDQAPIHFNKLFRITPKTESLIVPDYISPSVADRLVYTPLLAKAHQQLSDLTTGRMTGEWMEMMDLMNGEETPLKTIRERLGVLYQMKEYVALRREVNATSEAQEMIELLKELLHRLIEEYNEARNDVYLISESLKLNPIPVRLEDQLEQFREIIGFSKYRYASLQQTRIYKDEDGATVREKFLKEWYKKIPMNLQIAKGKRVSYFELRAQKLAELAEKKKQLATK